MPITKQMSSINQIKLIYWDVDAEYYQECWTLWTYGDIRIKEVINPRVPIGWS